MLGVVGGAFEAPEVGTHGGFATGGVFLSVEGCEVGCLAGRVVETGVHCRGDSGELRPDSLLFGGGLRGARHGTEASEVDAGAVFARSGCLTVRG